MSEDKYTMVLCEDGSGIGQSWWIIYERGKSYITHEFTRVPGGSLADRHSALELLRRLNENYNHPVTLEPYVSAK